MNTTDFDLVVIGAGSAGITAAMTANGLGKRVALVERSRIGGECTWSGCVPSKALIRAAHAARESARLAEFVPGSVRPAKTRADGALRYVRSVVERVYEGERPERFEALGIRVFFGRPVFADPKRLRLGDRVLSARRFLVATGSRPLVPPIEGLRSVPFLTSETVFAQKRLPKSMIVLGGGPIGLELAAAFNRLGVRVTVVEMMERVLYREEPELADALAASLTSEGVGMAVGYRALAFSRTKKGITLAAADASGARREFTADSVLVAVGRGPNVEDLALGAAGVAFDQRGVKVDAYMRTTAPGIYASGDVAGPYLFSHMAEAQSIVAVRNMFLPIKTKVDYTAVPWVTYTDPELARAGLTVEEARKMYGGRVRVYRSSYGEIDRGKTDGVGAGAGVFVCGARGKLLGIHILGPAAGELMQQALLALKLGVRFSRISSVVHAYPGYSDLVKRASRQAYIDELRNNPIVKTAGAIARLLKKVTG